MMLARSMWKHTMVMLLGLVWLACESVSSSGQPLREYLVSLPNSASKTRGAFEGCNVTVTGIQIHENRAFVALSRAKSSVPFTLGVVPLGQNRLPEISAYSSQELNELGNCQAIQSAINIHLDPVHRLWVLDDGLTDSPKRCTPKLLAIDVNTKKVIGTADLSRHILNKSQLANLVVDFKADGENFVYISDAPHRSVIVFDVLDWTARRVALPKEFPSSSILNIALVRKTVADSYLYFTYEGSDRLFSINAEYLRQKNNAKVKAAVQFVSTNPDIVLLGSNKDVVYFNYKNGHDVYKWNVETNFNQKTVQLVETGNSSSIPTAVALGDDKEIWVLRTNSFGNNNRGCSELRIKLL